MGRILHSYLLTTIRVLIRSSLQICCFRPKKITRFVKAMIGYGQFSLEKQSAVFNQTPDLHVEVVSEFVLPTLPLPFFFFELESLC